MGFLQEAKREACDDAESVLAVAYADWKGNGHGLLGAAALGQIRKIDRRFKKSGRRRILGGYGFHAQREGRQRELFVLEFEGGANRLARENVLGQLQAHGYAGESDGRKNSGHQNDGDQAGENQEE